MRRLNTDTIFSVGVIVFYGAVYAVGAVLLVIFLGGR